MIAEKHDGAVETRANVRLWLRLLSCTMTIEKSVRGLLAAEFGSTLPRFDVLAALDRSPDGMTMGELSRALLVSNGNVTAIVRALADEKLVVLARDESDRRSSVVRPTKAGRARFAAMASAHHDRVDALFSALDADERDRLFSTLDRLKASLGQAARKDQT